MSKVNFHHQLSDIPQAQWQRLYQDDYPFLRYEFLSALEQSGCVSDERGWHPLHLTIESDDGKLIAAMPLYLKSHSWGEYVFDWSWQQAWEQLGLAYFPKLVSAIPFTPVTGPRFLYDRDLFNQTQAWQMLVESVKSLCELQHYSGWHGLFVQEPLLNECHSLSLAAREDCQYHWFNRGYTDFDQFLATFTSRKRKNLRKERARVAACGITFKVLSGKEVSPSQLEHFYHFYQHTYRLHGQRPHLNLAFFEAMIATMPEQVVLILAYQAEEPIAAAWCYRDNTTLYGRHWGCEHSIDGLHFETCYYQGIEYCIAHGLTQFDPGAQGEHKIQRGFEPTSTWSVHWIVEPQLRTAVARFVDEERLLVDEQMQELSRYLPYHHRNH